jgi:hypothetical protein
MSPFVSKAQIAKFAELVKQGKISKATFNEWMRATKHPEYLPKRVEPKK